MSKLLLQARAVQSRFTLYVCTYVSMYNTLGYRYECRAAGPLGFSVYLTMLKQPGWAEDYWKHAKRFFSFFF